MAHYCPVCGGPKAMFESRPGHVVEICPTCHRKPWQEKAFGRKIA